MNSSLTRPVERAMDDGRRTLGDGVTRLVTRLVTRRVESSHVCWRVVEDSPCLRVLTTEEDMTLDDGSMRSKGLDHDRSRHRP